MASPIKHECHNCGASYTDRPNKVYCSVSCRRQIERKRANYDQTVKYLDMRRQRLKEARQAGNQQDINYQQSAINHLEQRLEAIGSRP